MSNSDSDQLYVQSLVIQMEKPDGSISKRSFLGLAIASKEEWDEMKKDSLADRLKSDDGKPPIMFEEPKKIERILTDNPNLEDVVDIVREEAHKYFESNGEN